MTGVPWSTAAWAASVLFVIASAGCAWCEGTFTRRRGLDIGFVSHGGMWGDLVLLPLANAVIVPWLVPGAWFAAAGLAGAAVSAWLHAAWYRGGGASAWREHLWPSRPSGRWPRDLSWAGWLHVVYVAAELTLLVGYALFPVPAAVVVIVSAVLTLHVPIGLFAPAWTATGGRFVPNRLLVPALACVWAIAAAKLALVSLPQ